MAGATGEAGLGATGRISGSAEILGTGAAIGTGSGVAGAGVGVLIFC